MNRLDHVGRTLVKLIFLSNIWQTFIKYSMNEAICHAINKHKIQDAEIKAMRVKIRKLLSTYVQEYNIQYHYKNGRWSEIKHTTELVAITINPNTSIRGLGVYLTMDTQLQRMIYNNKLPRLDCIIIAAIANTNCSACGQSVYNRCNAFIRPVNRLKCIPLSNGFIIRGEFKQYTAKDYIFMRLPLAYTEPASTTELMDFLREEIDPKYIISFIRCNIVRDMASSILFTDYHSDRTYPILQVLGEIYGKLFENKRRLFNLFAILGRTKISGQLLLRRYAHNRREPFKVKLQHNEPLTPEKTRALAVALCIAASVNIERIR